MGLGESCGNSVKVISHRARRCQRPGGGQEDASCSILGIEYGEVPFADAVGDGEVVGVMFGVVEEKAMIIGLGWGANCEL